MFKKCIPKCWRTDTQYTKMLTDWHTDDHAGIRSFLADDLKMDWHCTFHDRLRQNKLNMQNKFIIIPNFLYKTSFDIPKHFMFAGMCSQKDNKWWVPPLHRVWWKECGCYRVRRRGRGCGWRIHSGTWPSSSCLLTHHHDDSEKGKGWNRDASWTCQNFLNFIINALLFFLVFKLKVWLNPKKTWGGGA